MRIGFCGSTSNFSLNILIYIIQKNIVPKIILIKEDKKNGRGLKKNYSRIKKIALFYNIFLLQPNKLDKKFFLHIKQLNIDIIFIAGYGKIIPYYFFYNIRLGFFNLHPSLLPKWKGSSPIEHSINSGDILIGLTILQLDKKVDSGFIFLQSSFKVKIFKDYFILLEKYLSIMGFLLLKNFIFYFFKNYRNLLFHIQQNNKTYIKYAKKLKKKNTFLNWNTDRTSLLLKINAFSNYPGVFTRIENKFIKVLHAVPCNNYRDNKFFLPGYILKIKRYGIIVRCSNGFIMINKIQIPGRKEIHFNKYMNNYSKIIKEHMCFY